MLQSSLPEPIGSDGRLDHFEESTTVSLQDIYRKYAEKVFEETVQTGSRINYNLHWCYKETDKTRLKKKDSDK